MVTDRKNLLSALRRNGYERVPMGLHLCPFQVEQFSKFTGRTDYLDYFNVPYKGVNVLLEPAFDDGKEFYAGVYLNESVEYDPWGVARTVESEAAFHMRRLHSPLRGERRVEEILDYPYPRINASKGWDALAENVGCHQGSGKAVIGHYGQTIWEKAWAIRTMEALMMDMLSEPEKADALFDAVTERAVSAVEILTSAGCDILWLGDDIGMQKTPMMSLDLWRTFLKPRLAEVIQTAKSVNPEVLIFYHSCGYVFPFVDELIEIGVQILNPVQPESMPFEEVYERFGDRVAYWGTIGTQSTLPFGTPEEVYAQVQKNLNTAGPAGGILIAPTHLVEPEVPWENLIAMQRACEDYTVSQL